MDVGDGRRRLWAIRRSLAVQVGMLRGVRMFRVGGRWVGLGRGRYGIGVVDSGCGVVVVALGLVAADYLPLGWPQVLLKVQTPAQS